MFKRLLFLFILVSFTFLGIAQTPISSGSNNVDYAIPKKYEIGGITISGVKYLDHNVLIQLSGLSVGDMVDIPGEEVAEAIRKLWKQGLFSDVKITVTNIIDNRVFLDIFLQERPRLSGFTFEGLKKAEVDDIREKIKLVKGSQVTDNVIMTVENKIKDYFIDKGYLETNVTIVQEDDSNLVNNVALHIKVDKVEKVKINSINFIGATVVPEGKLRRSMKETKQKTWYNIFKTSKYIERNYEDDKKNLLAKYTEKGYRDAKVVKDSVYKFDEHTLNIDIYIEEGRKYYFRNITWVGNTKYKSEFLAKTLGIKKGEIYNQAVLEEKLFIAPNSVNSLYQDDGYLFSSVTPVEVLVENDSIDLEMRIMEGPQATVQRITITGNNKTNEHVVRREIRTRPGQLYNQSDVQRTIRELAQLGYFDPEKLNVNFNPDPKKGVVDLEYIVEEKSSDQFELSGGWGARMIVGSVGLSFNNFSARNMFKPQAWKPVPTGDGQRLSVRAQSNGLYYQAYNVSFVEPWLGGKKPNSLMISAYHTILSQGDERYKTVSDTSAIRNMTPFTDIQDFFIDRGTIPTKKIVNEDRRYMKITRVAVGMGRRLEWPDDFFQIYNELSYQHYNLNNYDYAGLFTFNDGRSNNISFNTSISRNSSGPNPIYPVKGSSYSLSLDLTPPYSYFLYKDDWWKLSDEEKEDLGNNAVSIKQEEDRRKYKWIEYHKWSFKSLNYMSLGKFGTGDLVLHTKVEFGYVGFYNPAIGPSPFEGYHMGGDGLMTYNIYGKETIPMRGYDNGMLTPYDKRDSGKKTGNIYDKFTFELRYPLSLNPSATFYVLAFAEAGNSWYDFSDFNAFDVKRSAGAGVRIFLPMFGKLGVDWGYGFDNDVTGQKSGSQFHFIIGQNF